MVAPGSNVPPKKGGRKSRLDPAGVARALDQLVGNVSAVARRFGVSRKAVMNLVNARPDLQQVLRDAREALVDHAESALFAAVSRGEAWAVCFALKTQGRSRGYVEKPESAAVVHQINWDGMVRGVWKPPPCPIEARLAEIDALPDPDPEEP